jgi:hypothetical protein
LLEVHSKIELDFFWDRGGSERINHRIFSFHRKFSLNKMTGWRFEPPTFGAESLQIDLVDLVPWY